MSSVPTFDQIGTKVKDLFQYNFHLSQIRLCLKNTVSPNICINMDSGYNLLDGKVTGDVSTVFDVPKLCFQATTKLTTNQEVITEFLVADKILLPGFNALFSAKLEKESAGQSGFIQATHEGKNHNVSANVQLPNLGVSSSNVFKYADVLVGCQGQLNTKTLTLDKNELAIAYEQNEATSIVSSCNNFKEFNIGFYKKLNERLEKGIQVSMDNNKMATLALGFAAAISPQAVVKAKMNNEGEVGIAYIHKFRTGIKLSASTCCDAKQFLSGNHQFGFGIELEG